MFDFRQAFLEAVFDHSQLQVHERCQPRSDSGRVQLGLVDIGDQPGATRPFGVACNVSKGSWFIRRATGLHKLRKDHSPTQFCSGHPATLMAEAMRSHDSRAMELRNEPYGRLLTSFVPALPRGP
jgi:hypothetical protein